MSKPSVQMWTFLDGFCCYKTFKDRIVFAENEKTKITKALGIISKNLLAIFLLASNSFYAINISTKRTEILKNLQF